MEPTLRDGDWLVYASAADPRLGDIVVARDPRDETRWIVKRVLDLSTRVVLGSDRPGHERVSVARANLVGTVVFRYWPLARLGPVSEKRRKT